MAAVHGPTVLRGTGSVPPPLTAPITLATVDSVALLPSSEHHAHAVGSR